MSSDLQGIRLDLAPLRGFFAELSPRTEHILDVWTAKGEVRELIVRGGIEPEKFRAQYAPEVFEYFLGVANGDIIDPRSNGITRLLDRIGYEGITTIELVDIFLHLKWEILSYVPESASSIAIVNGIHYIFEVHVLTVARTHAMTVRRLLDEYRVATDASSIVSITDPRGNIIYANDIFCSISGYSREELIGKNHNIIRHPDMPSEAFAWLWATIQSKRIWKWLVKNRKKDGDFYWVNTTIVPILDIHGEIVEYISIRADVTDLQESLKSIQEYDRVLNESNLVAKIDPSGRITSVNSSFSQILGYPSDRFIGQAYPRYSEYDDEEWLSSLPPDISRISLVTREIADDIWQTLYEKRVWKGVIKNRTRLRWYVWCSTTITPVLDSEGDIKEFILIATDVTDLEIAKDQIKKSLQELRELDEKKDNFLNIASHELRTPMTAIKGYISMVLEGDAGEISDEARFFLEKVLLSSMRLIELINDMLDIAKLEAGKHDFVYESVDMVEFLQSVVFELAPVANAKHIHFSTRLGFEYLSFETDVNKLKQALINILGNALKFTPDGGTVTLEWGISQGMLVIAVRDTGIGIPESARVKIFEKFSQVKGSLSRDTNGTGLWLAITKSIIEQLRGSISVESIEGEGSVFTIKLPLQKKQN